MNNAVTGDVEKQVEHIIEIIQSKKGEDITLLDVRGVTSIADFFVLTSGSSNVHVKAIADEVRIKMKKDDGMLPWHAEGFEALTWVLIDYVDIVVHVFDRDTRQYYAIEKLWKDAVTRHVETDY
ncbi:ribosome silencing factor [Candidatus Latescibacterota bacterium]